MDSVATHLLLSQFFFISNSKLQPLIKSKVLLDSRINCFHQQNGHLENNGLSFVEGITCPNTGLELTAITVPVYPFLGFKKIYLPARCHRSVLSKNRILWVQKNPHSHHNKSDHRGRKFQPLLLCYFSVKLLSMESAFCFVAGGTSLDAID